MVVGFLYTLSGGMLLVLGTGRPADLAWRFIRLVGLIAFALAVGASLWSVREAGWRIGAGTDARTWIALASALGAAVIALTAPLASRLPGMFGWTAMLAGALGMSAGGLVAIGRAGLLGASSGVPALDTRLLIGLGQVFSALMLGSITVAWLLGHAYLTQTRMTIAPLRHFSRMLTLTTALRIGFLLVSVIVGLSTGVGSGGSLPDVIRSAWLILSLRVGLGLVGVFVFAYMVDQCVRLRATQSATGILYFGSIFAYVGELANQHLIADVGWSF
jgi:hypothetical protein